MIEPQITIVVVPRERFSFTRESLESIYEHTQMPFKLVYVDGNSPSHIKRYLEEEARKRNFEIIRTDYYLSPNQGRNIGLRQVKTKYLVFIDNDVLVTAGWLERMFECAEETEASVVTPLTCEGTPAHEHIHCAGGQVHVREEIKDGTVRRRMREKMYKQGKKVEQVRGQLKREQTELAEFHCMFVRTEIFERIGGQLDEGMMNTKEHLDFCMTVIQAGGTVYFEPDSLVTYVPGPPLELSDMTFYMLRWSDAWELASLHRLRDKWNVEEDQYFTNRYRRVGWRRHMTITRPLAARIGELGNRLVIFGQKKTRLEKILVPMDKALNRYLTTSQARRLSQVKKEAQNPKQPEKTPVGASSR